MPHIVGLAGLLGEFGTEAAAEVGQFGLGSEVQYRRIDPDDHRLDAREDCPHLAHIVPQPGDACFHAWIVGHRGTVFDVAVRHRGQIPTATYQRMHDALEPRGVAA